MATSHVTAIRLALRAAADPERAPAMQAYMKSALPYLGVRVPEVRRITRRLAAADPPGDLDDLAKTAHTLWRQATYREERYAATGITGLRQARGELALLPLYHEMIVTGAWWDHVDEVAHRIGALLLAHPDKMRPVVCSWSTDSDRWLRRTSIICQLGAKHRTNIRLLANVIEANVQHGDFFVRKAIGWALREYAYSDPDWVRAFVADHPDLSPLSRREALKRLS